MSEEKELKSKMECTRYASTKVTSEYLNFLGKTLELRNRAAFFVRMVAAGKEFSQSQLQASSDPDLCYGELSSDSVICINKTIYNYLWNNLDYLHQDEWGDIEPDQKAEFRKVMEVFAKDMNDTVDSLIKGVKFAELPAKCREYILKDNSNREFMTETETQNIQKEIERTYKSWIDTLQKEVEDMEVIHQTNEQDVGPKSELEKWKYRMMRLSCINDFSKSPDHKLISKHFLDMKNKASTSIINLMNDMKQRKIETHTSHNEAKDNVKYLSTLEIYFDPLYYGTPDTIIDSLQSLMNSLKLISFTARYYDTSKMTNLFSRITDQMIGTCKEYILDKKHKSNNEDPEYFWRVSPDELIVRFQNCIRLYNTYKEKYKEAKSNSTSTNKENNFEFGEHQLFGKFDQFCKRLNKLIDLYTTIRQFEDIKKHKLDSMDVIEKKYDEVFEYFKSNAKPLLKFDTTRFDKDYVTFNLAISEIENDLHNIIGEEFKNLFSIEKKLKLLSKYEKILTKPNLQQNLKSEKIEIFSNYKREIDTIQGTFETGRTSPKLQRNMPKISGKIKWAMHLFNRIYPYIDKFKDINIKDRSETEVTYLTTNALLYSYIGLNEKFFEQFVESAKGRLSAPLLVERDGPRVNLDLYVLQLIREAKCMIRMNCNIPETAKIILLQEDKFKKYYNELNFLVKEYNRVLSRIGSTEAVNYFKSHIKDLNIKLQPLKSTINWSSMNIDTNLLGVFQCLQKLEYAIDAFYDVLENRVHRNMMGIKKLELIEIPENATNFSINELIRKQEEYVNIKNVLLKSKNNEIEAAILNIIQNIREYKLDPKVLCVEEKILYKLISDYEDKFYDFLITTTKNSLIKLKDRISSNSGEHQNPPIFKVDVNLQSKTIEIIPKVSVIQEAINRLAKSILYAMKDIYSWKKLDSEEPYSFHTKIGKDNEIIKMILLLTGSVQANNMEIDNYLKETFEEFKPLWTDSMEKKLKEFTNKKNKNYSDYEVKIKEYILIESKIKAIPNEFNFGAILINTKMIKQTLFQYCNDWKNAYSKELLRTTRNAGKELGLLISGFQEKLKKKPEKIEELKEVVDTISEIRKNEGQIEMQIKPFVQLYNLVKTHSKESDFERYNFQTKESYEAQWRDVLSKAASQRDELQSQQMIYRKRLYDDIIKLKNDLAELKKDYDVNGPTKAKTPIDAYERIEKYRIKVYILNGKKKNISDGEKLFNLTQSEYPTLDEIHNDLVVLGTLYDLYMSVIKQIDSWKDMQFMEVKDNLDEMTKRGTEFSSQILKVNKKLISTPEYEDLKGQISMINNTMEAFSFLIYPNFEEHHWIEISNKLDVKEMATVKSDQGIFRLKSLFDAKVHDKKGDLEDIQNIAANQQKIKDILDGIDQVWKTSEFAFVLLPSRKEVNLLDAQPFSDIKVLLEEHSGKISGYKSQAKALTLELNTRIKAKETQFQNIANNMDLWYSVQVLWGSLQSFFIGGDIRKDLPGPTKQFEQADKDWIKLMDKAVGTKSVTLLCSGTELTPVLNEIDKILKSCEQSLDRYLQDKREYFPRFFFVSTTVLLDILSKRTDPSSIKNNLCIIFDAINDIEFSEMDKKLIVKIMQCKSEGNYKDIQLVDLKEWCVKCEGKIEDWLNLLVKCMQNSIKALFMKAYVDYRQLYDGELALFSEYTKKYISQVTIFGIMIYGTKKLEEFVQRTSIEKGDTYKKKLIEARNNNNASGERDPVDIEFANIQEQLAALCREPQGNKLEIVKLETLIIIHVHSKDIFDFILKQKDHMVTVTDYDWLKQTRVYWLTIQGTCIVNITDVAFEYGYEFLGAKERLSITELTDKCYITLAQALGMNYGGAPAGPAGTGKTETVKDMGRTMGVFVLVTNCAPEHRYKNMVQIFKGLCRSGAWGCFDEFNRILLDVLSVVATIVSAIQDAKKLGKEMFKFPDVDNQLTDCALVATTAYFTTMNPGYAGRQELPENLKVLFRGVTMMLPDRQAIIRVKLSSYGFTEIDELSKKFAKLYNLCEDQLSKQKHYDFGLRNILSVLRAAGNEKKIIKEKEEEEKLIFIALKNMNESKFPPDDIDLFRSLIEDVFSNIKNVPPKVYKELEAKLRETLTRKKLDATNPKWIKKVIQTYETSLVRHGFMLVGETGTGKTTILESLTEAMSDWLSPSNKEMKWKIHRMNPKAIENDYMFIQKKLDTYILGTFTMLWKRCNENSPKGQNWLVCDGPVDTIWVESLNTVLDDNKILTLSNNDRIGMVDSCRMVFETENLKNAALSTVSRAGMIYITEEDIGYSPYINSWFLKNKDIFKDQRQKETELRELIEKKYLTDAMILELSINKNLKLIMNTSWLIKIKNFLLLIETLLQKKEYLDKVYLEKVVVFAFIWSIGGIYELDQRKVLHDVLVKKAKAPIPDIEGEKTIYDYNIGAKWEPWKTEEGPELKFSEIANFSNLIIPTMDSTRAIELIEKVAKMKIDFNSDRCHPILLLGDAGTAKTSTVLLYKKLRFNEKQILKRVYFSSATSPINFQETIDDEIEKTGNEYVPLFDKIMCVMLDDISMPLVNKWGDQMTLELVRQLLEQGGYYLIGETENRGNMKKVTKLTYIGAMNHPKGGKNDIPNRLKRQFYIFNMTLPNEISVNDIYARILRLFFNPKSYPDLTNFAQGLTKLTVEALNRIKTKFVPTPIKFHYNFNLRDISRTFQGIFQSGNSDALKNSLTRYKMKQEVYLITLWKHEVDRVMSDKLRDEQDKKDYKSILDSTIEDVLTQEFAQSVKEDLYFCDYLREIKQDPESGRDIYPKAYELIETFDKLKSVTTMFMDKLKEEKKKKHVNLVLFDDCLKYLIRITRVISTNQGSIMLVGVGGSGKQSLVRLASWVCQQFVVQLGSDRCDKVEELKAEFRIMYTRLVEEYNPSQGKDIMKHTLLMTDAELKLESFIETISSFLATGEIANIYAKKEDKLNILNSTRGMINKNQAYANRTLDDNEIWLELISTVKNHIHISLCFSPSSVKFRDKFIKFPVLFNNCTITWLLSWPEQALISVVQGSFKSDKKLDIYAKPEQINNLYLHISNVHMSIQKVCDLYKLQKGRYVYVTPKSYLSFIDEYTKLYKIKKDNISQKETIINTGLNKLTQASKDIEVQKKELSVKMEEVDAEKKKVEEIEKQLNVVVEDIRKKEDAANIKKEECEKNADIISHEADQVSRELAEAEPILKEAVKKMNEVDKKIMEGLLGLKKPSNSIKFYLECMALIMNKRLFAITDILRFVFNSKGDEIVYYNDSWQIVLTYISGGEFLSQILKWSDKLKNGKPLVINDETLELIKPLNKLTKIGLPGAELSVFNDDIALSAGGKDMAIIAGFCKIIEKYINAVKDVTPKKMKVDQKMDELHKAKEELRLVEENLEKIRANKKEMEEKLNEKKKQKEEKEEIADRMKRTVDMATNLIDSLSGEKIKWKEDSKNFENQKKQLLGDAAICCAFIAYAGPFNFEFRQLIVKDYFRADINAKNLPITDNFEIENFLVDETTKGQWNQNKLPSDQLSIQNGILVTRASRYPILIDPQNQAKTWILTTNVEIETNKHIFQMKVAADKFEQIFAPLFQNGEETVIEGIENDIDSKLDPLLDKQLLSSSSTSKMKKLMVGDKIMDFNNAFKLYLLCKLINPHFTPEIYAKCTVIDFNVTIVGLEQQLQGIVISKEQKSLEETLRNILTDIQRNIDSLLRCQKDILDNLNKEGDLLENQEIIPVLNSSKKTSDENSRKIKEAKEKAIDIEEKRSKYLPVATRGSALYFSIVDMQEISKMYSSSLQQFTDLFENGIDQAIPSQQTEIRVKNIVKKISECVYKYIVRGLFSKDKLAYILITCFKILVTEKVDNSPLLNNADIKLLLRGGAAINPVEEEDCPIDALVTKGDKKPKEWLNLLAITKHKFNGHLPVFAKLIEKIKDNMDKFKGYYFNQEIEKLSPFPYEDIFNQSNNKLVEFLKFVFIRSLRDDRASIYATQSFILAIFDDKDFLKPYPETLEDYLKITNKRCPVLYLLSAGADPTSTIEDLRIKKHKNMHRVSMGENQEPVARSFFNKACENGDWVMLQNCHLGLAYMNELDTNLKNIDINIHEDMRIWLSCAPSDDFPIGLLHQSLKITNEPPKGIKASMIKTFSTIVSQDMLDKYEFKEWKSLVFTLSFLHSIVLERKKYGPLGWCVPYDFNNSDIEASIIFVDKQFEKGLQIDDKMLPNKMINFKTLVNVVSVILYGGRIIDRKDGELFKVIIESYLEDSFFTRLSNLTYYPTGKDQKKSSVVYSCPDGTEVTQINQYINHISGFSDIDPPQVFGLHGSADLSYRIREFNELISVISDTQPKEAGGGGSGADSKDSIVKRTVMSMLNNLPEEFQEKEFRIKIDNLQWFTLGKGLAVPLHNVLLQETTAIQNIIVNVKTSLSKSRDALDGKLMMTEDIVMAIDYIFEGKPPNSWMFDAGGGEISWLSSTVGNWFSGLRVRADKMREWLSCEANKRPSFYLPGFLNPQGFIAAFKQECFKVIKNQPKSVGVTLDQISIQFNPDKSEVDPAKFNQSKVYKSTSNDPQKATTDNKSIMMVLYGIYLEGAIWSGNLADDPDSNSRNTVSMFPCMGCIGYVEEKTAPTTQTYKCPVYKYLKRADKYFILEIPLKITGNDQNQGFWQKRGVALLCNKD